jgi:HemY protein
MDWQGYRIDTSVGLLAVVLAMAALILAQFVRLFLWARRAPGRWIESRRERRRERGYEALSHGMAAVAAGAVDEAKRLARRADSLLDDRPLTLLLSAQAAQLGGDETAARRYFTQMLEKPETEFLGLRGLLTQALKAGNRGEALVLAERAFALRPTASWLVPELFDLRVGAGRWREAEALIDRIERHKSLTPGEAKRHRAVVLLQRSRESADDSARALARGAFDLRPDLAPAAIAAAERLAAAGKRRRAERVLDSAWRMAPHPALAKAYLDLKPELNALDRLRRLQTFVASNAEHLESRIALADAALAADLWGEARRHLAAAANAMPTPRVFRLLARVEEAERQDTAAARHWLERAQHAEPDPTWVCERCGAQAAEWAARCGHCEAFDSIAWKPPPRVVRLLPTAEATPPALPPVAAEPGDVPEIPAPPKAGAAVADKA